MEENNNLESNTQIIDEEVIEQSITDKEEYSPVSEPVTASPEIVEKKPEFVCTEAARPVDTIVVEKKTFFLKIKY